MLKEAKRLTRSPSAIKALMYDTVRPLWNKPKLPKYARVAPGWLMKPSRMRLSAKDVCKVTMKNIKVITVMSMLAVSLGHESFGERSRSQLTYTI